MSDLRARCIEAGEHAYDRVVTTIPAVTIREVVTAAVDAVLPLVLAEQPQYEQVGWWNGIPDSEELMPLSHETSIARLPTDVAVFREVGGS